MAKGRGSPITPVLQGVLVQNLTNQVHLRKFAKILIRPNCFDGPTHTGVCVGRSTQQGANSIRNYSCSWRWDGAFV